MINVLIVDDEEQIREGIKGGIDWSTYGINIVNTVGSASEALNAIELSAPHAIILDIKMSEMDGLELLEIIHEKYSSIKVVLISGYDDFSYAQKAIELNAFCYLLKPLDDKELLSKILEIKQLIESQLSIVRKDEEFKKKFEENMPILRDNFFLQLMRGKISEFNSFKEKIDFLKLKLESPEYLVITLDLDNNSTSKSSSVYDQNVFKFAIMSTAENLFNKAYSCYCFNMDDNIGLLISGSALELMDIKNICVSLKEWVNATLSLSISIGIGSVCQNFSHIMFSCRESLDALAYKLILGRNEVIDVSNFPEIEKTKLTETGFDAILKDREEGLIYAIRCEDLAAAEEKFKGIILTLKKLIEVDIKMTNRLVYLLSFFLTKLLISLDISLDSFLEEETNFYTILEKFKTIEDINDYIKKYLQRVMLIFQEKQKKNANYHLNKAIEFINNNKYNDISLTNVANSLYIHPNYLSKIFKQNIGTSFVEYAINLKMNEAKKLLKSSNFKVYKIADMLQYKDINHFTRLFKKTFGLSPSDYRDLL
jgi:two-component system, response regulator YesN